MTQNELYHHGILGQKWGVRRYQNADGSLTSAGKKRYEVDEAKESLKNAKSNYKITKRQGDKEAKNEAKQKINDAKERLDSAKKETGLVADRKHKLIDKYKEQGLGDEAAETAARQRLKAEIAVAAVGTVAAAVIVAKGSKYLGQQYCDKTIKSGHIIQNLGTDPNDMFNKGNPFFAAINNSDIKLYGKTFYPNKIRISGKTGVIPDVYKNQIKLNEDIKRASVNNAKKTFYEMMDKDPKFKTDVLSSMMATRYNDGVREYLQSGKKTNKLYESFNQALATESLRKIGADKQYMSELQKKGYGAILDINDTRRSEYKQFAKEPTIFFSDKLGKVSSIKMDHNKSMIEASEYVTKLRTRQLMKNAVVGVGSNYASRKVADSIIVSRYLKEHPDSKLTAKEILENYRKNA